MKTFMLAEDNRFENVRAGLPRRAVEIVRESAFIDSLVRMKRDSLWVVRRGEVLRGAIDSQDERIFKNQITLKKHSRIFLLGEISADYLLALDSLFKEIIVLSQHSVLPIEELFEVRRHKNPENYVIGGQIDESTHTLTLVRGNLSRLVVPLSTFKTSGDGVTPNFNNFTVDDHGQTLKFGEYEAAVDSVLYEFDPEYRKKRRSDLAKKDKGFGACLRRLRLQKGLNQADFPDIDAREIGRIERGEVKPRKATIEHIAHRLDVDPDDIKSY
jgi:hypothetical protein